MASAAAHADDNTVPIKEVEELLSLSHAKIYEEINTGRFKTFKVGKRRFVSVSALDKYVEDSEAEAALQAA